MAGEDPNFLDIDRDGVIRIGERINFAQSEFKKKSKELETQLGNMNQDWMGEGGAAFGKLMSSGRAARRRSPGSPAVRGLADQTQKTSTEQDSTQADNMFPMNKNLDQ